VEILWQSLALSTKIQDIGHGPPDIYLHRALLLKLMRQVQEARELVMKYHQLLIIKLVILPHQYGAILLYLWVMQNGIQTYNLLIFD
jgi:hypothetical protein